MNSQRHNIAVYGATGHTGQFVVQEAQRCGLSVVAVGRSAARLDEVFALGGSRTWSVDSESRPQQGQFLPGLQPHSPAMGQKDGKKWTAEVDLQPTISKSEGLLGVPRRIADLADPASLEQAFAGCAVVINCAGPFLDTAAPVAQAALRAGCHYIDVTAEQASAQASLADFDAPARAAGKVVIPAAAFYGGLADLLASALASAGSIDAITVAIGLDRWWPTAGTRKTGERNTVPRQVVAHGRLVPLVPSEHVPDWAFAAPLGTQAMVEIPFSEVITLAHHLPVGNIRSLLNRSALQDIRDADTPPPTATDDSGRSAQRFELMVQLVQDGKTLSAGVRGQDIYAVTAPIVVEVAQRLLAPAYARSGALALAQAVEPVDLLRSLHGTALEVFGEALPA